MSERLGVKRVAGKWVASLLSHLLPNHGQRAIFLTTLIMENVKLTKENEGLIKQLNAELRIVKDQDAMQLPAKLHDTLWGDRKFQIREEDRELTDYEIEGICHRIIRDFPDWTRYSDYETVLEETRAVVKTCLSFNRAQVQQQLNVPIEPSEELGGDP